MSKIVLSSLLALLAVLLAGCKLGPNFSRPEAPQEKSYTKEGLPPLPPPGGTDPQQHFVLGQKLTGEWWALFHSSALNQVVEQAFVGNRTLVTAEASLAQAREVVVAATAGLYPQVNFAANAERQKESLAAFGLPQPPVTFNLFSLGPTVSYALDVFGGTKRTIEEEQSLSDYQQFQLSAAYLTLTGNAVTQAIAIASTRAQIRTLEGIIADDERNLALVRREVAAGEASQLDVETATSQLAADRTQLPPLLQQLNVTRHALAVLVGRRPSEWEPPDFDLADLTLPTDLPVTLPSELVRQRPDILAGEAQLHAASAAVGVATANLYPQLTLSASTSQIANRPNQLFTEPANIWSLALGLTQPVFEGGQLEAQRRAAVDAFHGALASYEQIVLQSFGQVADSLDALSHDAELLDAEHRAVDSADAYLRLTRTAYAAGNVGILQVLDAQRQSEQSRLGYVRAQAQRYQDTAQLFLAIGGGWWNWTGQRQERSASPRTLPASAH